MKKVLIGVGIAVVVAVGGLLGAAAMQPNELVVERTATIEASADTIMPMCTDLKVWNEWNPWAELDPDMELTFTEPSSGVGASYSWVGDDNVGKGKMTITKIDATSVEYDLAFEEPFEDQSVVRIELAPSADGTSTQVTWKMEGENKFIAKIFMLFMDMDAMIGSDFERGLKNLAAKATG